MRMAIRQAINGNQWQSMAINGNQGDMGRLVRRAISMPSMVVIGASLEVIKAHSSILRIRPSAQTGKQLHK